jgi:hypothetical protein
MLAIKCLTMAGVVTLAACSRTARRVEPVPPLISEPARAPASGDSMPEKRPVVAISRTVSRPVRFRAGDAETVERFVPYVALPSDSGECAPREPSPTGDGEMAMLYYPSRANAVAVSIVTIAANGRLVRFNDRRGGLRIPATPGFTKAEVDSTIAVFLRTVPRTTITLDYHTGRAFVINEGGNRPADGFTVPIHFIARYPRFDSPDVRARAIVARCR